MNAPLSSVDWSLIQTFLAVAENGSLSAAARALGASQPTLGRQIKALETQLDAQLFQRHAKGFVLTDTGASLMAPARAMRDAMGELTLTAAGQSAKMKGTVRITASVMTAQYHLPPIIADIRRAEPDVAIELAPSDSSSNLLYREADIAVRMYRPTQLDLVTQFVGDVPLVVCAAKSYLQARGPMRSMADLPNHDFVGYDVNTRIIDGLKEGGVDVTRDFFMTRCDDQATFWGLIRAGCGIGFGQALVVQQDPLVDVLDIGVDIPPLPIWLTAHEAMRETPRIRRVWDLLLEGLKPLVS